MRWIIILIIVLVSLWFYQRPFAIPVVDKSLCITRGGAWDEDKKQCDPDAKKHCLADGYQWDEVGNRCLITDYQL